MLTKTVITPPALAILVCGFVAAPALAKGPADARTGNNNSQLESCHPQDAGTLPSGTDFVAVPYTFGSTLDYRPAWTGDMQGHTDVRRRMSKRLPASSPVPHC